MVGDQAVLLQMKLAGADLSKPTHIIHYVYFKDEAAAAAAQASVPQGLGAIVARSKSKSKSEWLLKVEHTDVPTLATIGRVRELLTVIARERSGEYDGWEAAIR